MAPPLVCGLIDVPGGLELRSVVKKLLHCFFYSLVIVARVPVDVMSGAVYRPAPPGS